MSIEWREAAPRQQIRREVDVENVRMLLRRRGCEGEALATSSKERTPAGESGPRACRTTSIMCLAQNVRKM